MIHELKSWVGLFEPIYNGEKTHELRVLDRDYKVGDFCLLREYHPTEQRYTGRKVWVEITYITSSKHQECAVSPTALHFATGILSIKKFDPRDKINELFMLKQNLVFQEKWNEASRVRDLTDELIKKS